MRELHGVSSDSPTFAFQDEQEVRAMVAMVADRVTAKLSARRPAASSRPTAKAAKPSRPVAKPMTNVEKFQAYNLLLADGFSDEKARSISGAGPVIDSLVARATGAAWLASANESLT